MKTRRAHILSADEFIEQGTSAGAILSIASSQTNPTNKSILEHTAREVARKTGQPLAIPSAIYNARNTNYHNRKAANDNRRPQRRAA